jgi:MPBQ/MSBQ methyltransferase
VSTDRSQVLISHSQSARRDLVMRQYAFTFSDSLVQQWFESSGFANFGYWDGATTATEASNALVDRLIAMVPAPEPQWRVLDVGCGGGGTTSRLTRYFQPDHLVGINISPEQLARARQLVPGATFQQMDAVDLQFDAASFDLIVCVEAAHHFETRTRFLAEAFRVLKPGGRLVLCDALFSRGRSLIKDLRNAGLRLLPPLPPADFVPANIVSNLEAYTDLFRLVGFDAIIVDDAIERTWRQFYRRQWRFLLRAVWSNPRLIWTVRERLLTFARWNTLIYAYPLLAARKPTA